MLPEERKESLRVSFIDGIFASIMFGLTTNYITPFALSLGASNYHIGLINSLPQLFGSGSQLTSSYFVEKFKSRKRFITYSVYLHAFSLMLVFLIPVLMFKWRIELFLILLILNTVFSAISSPAWSSLMSDTVPKNEYGRYFAWRGKLLGIITLFSNFLAGLILQFFFKFGFAILFIIASVCRFISGYFLSLMKDVHLKVLPEQKFSYYQFIKRFKESNFVKFVIFVSGLNFATFLAAPFFTVYMLREMKIDYVIFALITTAGALAGLFTLPFWGKLADRFGNARVVKFSAIFLPVLPVLWIFSKDIYYLVLINAFAGYIWAGFNLSAINFTFDAASQPVRTRCIAYFNFTNGIAICFGSLLGGYLAMNLPKLDGSRLLMLFFVSGVLRGLICLLLINSFQEVRETEKIKDYEFLSIITGIKLILSLSEDFFIYRKKALTSENRTVVGKS